jgi:anti-sigma regulatory factor (Ser/Thr protein kinase)
VRRQLQSWPARPQHVGAARRAASAAAARAGADPRLLDAVRLAVSEALSNVIPHGYRSAPEGAFVMAVEWGEAA